MHHLQGDSTLEPAASTGAPTACVGMSQKWPPHRTPQPTLGSRPTSSTRHSTFWQDAKWCNQISGTKPESFNCSDFYVVYAAVPLHTLHLLHTSTHHPRDPNGDLKLCWADGVCRQSQHSLAPEAGRCPATGEPKLIQPPRAFIFARRTVRAVASACARWCLGEGPPPRVAAC